MSGVQQVTEPTEKEFAEILNLFREIPGRTCTAANYLKYLMAYWEDIAVVTVTNGDGSIIAFTQAQAPDILEPQIGWLPFSCVSRKCKKMYSQLAQKIAEQWLRDRGAKICRMQTVRTKTKAFKKSWGFEVSREILMEKEL